MLHAPVHSKVEILGNQIRACACHYVGSFVHVDRVFGRMKEENRTNPTQKRNIMRFFAQLCINAYLREALLLAKRQGRHF